MGLEREKSRFYNYPPFLPSVNHSELLNALQESSGKKEAGLYIHIPFCKKLCFFCPYTKYVKESSVHEAYVEALKKEILLVSSFPSVKNTTITSVFFGGGTPTMLSTQQLSELLSFCRKNFSFAENIQVSVEANPATTEEKTFLELKKAGFNRISFGVQSFDNKTLKLLGTAHSSEQAVKAVNSAKKFFSEINIDLMYRLPGQTVFAWKKDLLKAVSLNVSHITTYALDLVQGTTLFILNKKNALQKIPSFDEEKKMMVLADRLLSKKGFKRYLVDQFALNGKENKYAIQTLLGNVLGLGCGAFSHFNVFEFKNFSVLEKYFEATGKGFLPAESGKKLSEKELMERFMIKHSMLLEFSADEFKKQFGKSVFKVFGRQLKKLKALKLISVKGNKIRVTSKGRMYIYNIHRSFYPKEFNQVIQGFEKAGSG
ncbi:MAG: radical SAM family heme chaperone HemW [archaeon]